MGTPQDRVQARFLTDLPVTMKWRRNAVSVRATDASDGGVFIRSDEQPAIRELVRLEFTLPGRAEPFAVHGMPVNCASANDPEGREPGVGIQFYGLDRDSQRVWGQFIENLRRTQSPLPKTAGPRAPRHVAPPVANTPPRAAESPSEPEVVRLIVPSPLAHSRAAAERAPEPKAPHQAQPQPQPQPKPPAPEAVEEEVADEDLAREEFPELADSGASLELEIASEEDLYEFYMRDIAAGGMFILSDVALPEGARLTLFIRHPLVDDTFELEAVVRTATEGPDGPGLEVEFIDLGEPRLDALRDFIERDLEASVAPSTAPTEAGAAVEQPPSWQQPFDDGRPQGKLAQLFDPWTGDTPERPWSKPPPEDEFDSLFDALSGDSSGVRHSVPAPSNEEVPDFLMAIPSWSKLESPQIEPAGATSIELDACDLVEVREDKLREALRAHDEATRGSRQSLPRAR